MSANVRVEQLGHAIGLPLPSYQTLGSAGADLVAAVPTNEPVVIEPGQRTLIPTGLRMAIPSGFEAQLRPRSGLALRNGIMLVNSPGTIDSDYRGEIGVLLGNLGQSSFVVERGMRIAQLILARVERAEWLIDCVDQTETMRGSGGFGSTGERPQAHADNFTKGANS